MSLFKIAQKNEISTFRKIPTNFLLEKYMKNMLKNLKVIYGKFQSWGMHFENAIMKRNVP